VRDHLVEVFLRLKKPVNVGLARLPAKKQALTVTRISKPFDSNTGSATPAGDASFPAGVLSIRHANAPEPGESGFDLVEGPSTCAQDRPQAGPLGVRGSRPGRWVRRVGPGLVHALRRLAVPEAFVTDLPQGGGHFGAASVPITAIWWNGVREPIAEQRGEFCLVVTCHLFTVSCHGVSRQWPT